MRTFLIIICIMVENPHTESFIRSVSPCGKVIWYHFASNSPITLFYVGFQVLLFWEAFLLVYSNPLLNTALCMNC